MTLRQNWFPPEFRCLMNANNKNIETLAGNKKLLDMDFLFQVFDCDGADRTVTLPRLASSNHAFVITNATAATYTLTVKHPDTTTMVVLAPGQTIEVASDSVGWRAISGTSSSGAVGLPAGADKDVQINVAGAFGADTGNFTYDTATKTLTLTGTGGNAIITGVADGDSEGIELRGGDASETDYPGGMALVEGGLGDGTGAGGAASCEAGEGGATGKGGKALLHGGPGGNTSGDGGAAEVLGGDAQTDGDGGAVNIAGGAGADGGADGVTTIGDGGSTDYVQITRAGVMSFVGGALILLPTKTPATSGASGVAGEICWDASYIYICVAANTWKRAGIGTW